MLCDATIADAHIAILLLKQYIVQPWSHISLCHVFEDRTQLQTAYNKNFIDKRVNRTGYEVYTQGNKRGQVNKGLSTKTKHTRLDWTQLDGELTAPDNKNKPTQDSRHKILLQETQNSYRSDRTVTLLSLGNTTDVTILRWYCSPYSLSHDLLISTKREWTLLKGAK